MNGDLISRSALKKDFEERNKACDKWIANAKDEETKIRADATKHFICEVIMTIDKAPTIEPEKMLIANVNFDENKLKEIVQTEVINKIKSGELVLKGEWIPISERLPEEKINPYTLDFEYVLCSTIWDDIRPYKYGKSKGDDKVHFWYGGRIMDEAVIAWQPLPEPYKKGGTE